MKEGDLFFGRQLDENPGPLRTGERNVEQKVGDEPLQGDVERPHQLSLVEEEQERLEGLEERPLGQDANALVGKDFAVRLPLVLA